MKKTSVVNVVDELWKHMLPISKTNPNRNAFDESKLPLSFRTDPHEYRDVSLSLILYIKWPQAFKFLCKCNFIRV